MTERTKTGDAVESAMLRRDVEDLKRQVGELTEKIEAALIAWSTANHLLAFIKWTSGLATAAMALWASFKFFKG